ncbi:unnamed protein product [Notodromas monacha]|uniref:ribonuclease Z n=1 Tax=Notodromas monacha TaxID=399045 RepID=A0A7R9GDS4_9CRUS|nr:unnamed protein product [Notodromas monacha]CAG0919013.1 unnamed protein product [Notodromas monacha]
MVSGCSLQSDPKKLKTLEIPEEMKKREVGLIYIVTTRPKLGTLLLDKCIDCGVPTGPLLGKLKNNIPVTLPDGRVVDPKDVRSPDDPGRTFWVVECPGFEYLDSFCSVSSSLCDTFLQKPEEEPSVIVHFTPMDIVNEERYRNWIKRFPDAVVHLFLNEEVPCSGAIDVHRLQTKLNLLDSRLFPALNESYPIVNEMERDYEYMKIASDVAAQNAYFGYPGVRFRLRARRNEPILGLDRQSSFLLKHQEYIDEVTAFPDAVNLIEGTKEKIREMRSCDALKNNEYPEIVFAGTGSAIPNKSRNTSGILVTKSENSRILMDCGEGTLGQIARFFGAKNHVEGKNVWDVLRELDAIYVSHLHADHHIGLVGLLRARKRAFDKSLGGGEIFKPVMLLAPVGLKWWLNWFSDVFEDIRPSFVFFDNRDLMREESGTLRAPDCVESLKRALDLEELETCFVPHCLHAFGFRFRPRGGRSLVYSGDCRPSDNLVKLGDSCDILIHEATVEDDLAEDAEMKRHCTASEAFHVAKRMKAKHIMFTHFSQRYKIPVLSEEVAARVGIAFDNMRVSSNVPYVLVFFFSQVLMNCTRISRIFWFHVC